MALVTIAGDVRDSSGRKDNRPWYVWAADYQDGNPGVITPRESKPQYPSNGVLTLEIEGGISAWIKNPDGQLWLVETPVTDGELWAVIEAGVAYPPDTSQARLNAAVYQYVEAHRNQFKTRAVPITEGPDAGKAQWVDANDDPVGDPVTWDQVIATAVAEAAATAAANTVTPGIVTTYAESLEPQIVTGDTPGTQQVRLGEAEGPEFVASGVSELDPRLDDNRTPVDGSVTLAKLGAALAATLGGLSSQQFSTSIVGVLNADTAADSTAKVTRYGVLHYDADEEPFYGARMESTAAQNIVSIGGGTSVGNAATDIYFYTAANNATLTGVLATVITSAGFLSHKFNAEMQGDLTVGTDAGASGRFLFLKAAAGQNRVLSFRSGASARWDVRTSNTAEAGSDAGSNFEIRSYTDAGAFKATAFSINRATGQITLGGALSAQAATLTGLLTTPASASGGAGLRVTPGVAPSTPVDGDVWIDGSGNLCFQAGGVTKTVTAS